MVVNGLKGFPDATNAISPETQIQSGRSRAQDRLSAKSADVGITALGVFDSIASAAFWPRYFQETDQDPSGL